MVIIGLSNSLFSLTELATGMPNFSQWDPSEYISMNLHEEASEGWPSDAYMRR